MSTSTASRVVESLASPNLSVTLASGEPLEVRRFVIEERLSAPFEIELEVVSETSDVDFEAAIGAPARFAVRAGGGRFWSGVCARLEQISVEEQGLSVYSVRLAPTLWLLGHRRTYRIFQDQSELDVVVGVLGEWGIVPILELDPAQYPKRRYRTQYGETDLAFISRLLEDIGVAYHFEQVDDATRLVLVDAPNRRAPSASLPFIDKPNERLDKRYVTDVRARRELRPGRFTQSDVDYRKPLDYPLASSAARGTAVEARLESYQHDYGSFLWKGPGGGNTPHADDRGPARTNERQAAVQVKQRLESLRGDGRVCAFKSSDYDLRPGAVLTVTGHPRDALAAPLLVVGCHFQGASWGEWELRCEARFADMDFRPPLSTPRPTTRGVESATVTGPAGEEIHTDEFGRVRVHFHWDREGTWDEHSSCWIPVNQPWAGAGFGAVNIPRVGQEVLVDFLGADPDRPVVIGRVFTQTTPPPYKLPELKMVGGMRSNSYPAAKPKVAARMGGGPSAPAALADEGDGGGEDGSTAKDPELFEGMDAPEARFAEMVQQVKSYGPDPTEHGLPANAVTMDDRAGEEKLYLQAQKDLRLNAKGSLTGTVGLDRTFTVGGDDAEQVAGNQTTQVVKDRTIAVTSGNQFHGVQKDIVTQGLANALTIIKGSLSVATQEGSQVYAAKTGFVATVNGTATLYMDPTAIVIDAPHVYINPGAKVMAQIFSGTAPADAVAAAEREARIENAAAEMAAKLHAAAPGYNWHDELGLVASGQVTADNFGHDDTGRWIDGTRTSEAAWYRAQDFENAGLTPEEAQEAARRAQQILQDNMPKGQE